MTSEYESSFSGSEETQNTFEVTRKRRYNESQSNSNKIIKSNKGNSEQNKHTILLLIHRVFITFFARHLKRNLQFKKSVFLSKNPFINYSTFDKFERNLQINNMLQNLESLHGVDFLLNETSVPWLTNGAFICINDIPQTIMSKYTSEPHRLRALSAKKTPLKSHSSSKSVEAMSTGISATNISDPTGLETAVFDNTVSSALPTSILNAGCTLEFLSEQGNNGEALQIAANLPIEFSIDPNFNYAEEMIPYHTDDVNTEQNLRFQVPKQDSDVIFLSKEVGNSLANAPLQSLLRHEEIIPNLTTDSANALEKCRETFSNGESLQISAKLPIEFSIDPSFNDAEEMIPYHTVDVTTERNIGSGVPNTRSRIVSNNSVALRKKVPLNAVNKVQTIRDPTSHDKTMSNLPIEATTEPKQDSDVMFLSKVVGKSLANVPLQSLLRHEDIIPNVTIDSAKALENCWKTFGISFQSGCLQSIVGPVERSVNGVSLKKQIPVTNHAYMYLQHQDNMNCWRHSLCAILGWNIHPEITSSEWLVACMAVFSYVPKQQREFLEKDLGILRDDSGEIIFNEPNHYDFIPAASQCNSFIYDEEELAYKVQRYSTWLKAKNCQKHGLTKVEFHEICSSINGRNDSIYIGCENIEPDTLMSYLDIARYLRLRNANCCAVYHKLKRRTPRELSILTKEDPYYNEVYHYSTFWLWMNRSLLHYDSFTRKLSEYLPLLESSSAGQTFISEYEGLIFGKTAKNQALFYFDVQTNWNLSVPTSVQEKVKANLTSLTDFVYLDVMQFREAGINVPSLRLFPEFPKLGKHVYKRNNIMEVRQSNLRNLQTYHSIGLGLFAIEPISSHTFVEVVLGAVVRGSFLELLQQPFVIVCYKDHDQYVGIDLRATTLKGECFTWFANYAHPGYYFHGGSSPNPQANVELCFNQFGVMAYVRAIRNINPGDEMYLSLPNGASKSQVFQYLVPNTIAMEQHRNLNPSDFPMPEIPHPEICLSIIYEDVTAEERLRAKEFFRLALIACPKTPLHVIEADNLHLLPGTFLKFKPGEWACDHSIDAWSTVLRDIDHKLSIENPHRKKTLLLNTCIDIFQRIQMEDWEGLNRLFRKTRIDANLSFLDYDRYVIPLNHGNQHWALMVAYLDRKTLVYIDSFHKEKPPKDQDPKLLLKFLNVFAELDKRCFDIDQWRYVSAKPIKQIDGTNCGFHVMLNMYLIIHDLPFNPTVPFPNGIKDFMDNTFRIRVLLSILDGRIKGHPTNDHP